MGLLRVLFLCLAPLITASLCAQNSEALERIAFGSCLRQDRDLHVLDVVIEQKPDLFLFLGDNIYGDTEDMKVMQEKYDLLGSRETFQRLRKEMPILATWDDHDYGANDAGKEYPMKSESEAIFLDFWKVPAESPSRKRPGIYSAHLFGPPGKRIQVVLLDTRSFRDSLEKRAKREGGGPWGSTNDQTKTILGEPQWKWLREQLLKPAEFRVIGTSIQFLPQDHHWESWKNFPHERARMLDLIRKTKAGGVLFLSGDRHLAELSILRADEEGSPGWPLIEITASGLTHASGGNREETNRHRMGGDNFRGKNFGMLSFDWDAMTVAVEVRDEKGENVRQWSGSRKDLLPK